MSAMWSPASGGASMDDLLARMAKVLAEIREVNKHVEWIEARLYEVTKKAEGEQ